MFALYIIHAYIYSQMHPDTKTLGKMLSRGYLIVQRVTTKSQNGLNDMNA